jgi:hypothetical protein
MNPFSTTSLAPAAHTDEPDDFAEEFRKPLISVNTCLSLYAGIQRSRQAPGMPEWQPWDRIEKVLFENLTDLMNHTPVGERLISQAALLSLISEGLGLLDRDREFHFLLSLYMQSCLLINLIQAETSAGNYRPEQWKACRLRIQTSLDFVTTELAELGRRRSRNAA